MNSYNKGYSSVTANIKTNLFIFSISEIYGHIYIYIF